MEGQDVSEERWPACVVVLDADLSDILEVDASLSLCLSCEAELLASAPPDYFGFLPFLPPFLTVVSPSFPREATSGLVYMLT